MIWTVNDISEYHSTNLLLSPAETVEFSEVKLKYPSPFKYSHTSNDEGTAVGKPSTEMVISDSPLHPLGFWEVEKLSFTFTTKVVVSVIVVVV